jgi:hypothetical protein
MARLIPLDQHLPDFDRPGAMSRSEAARAATALREMRESVGWEVLLEQIAVRLRYEQGVLMKTAAREGDDSYERIIGQWAGMERVAQLVEGVIRYGEKAMREMESGRSAETENRRLEWSRTSK